MGTKWCCSGFRDPESKVYADPDGSGLTDVSQFVADSNLQVEVEDEMAPVADTFRGVENLNGVFNWERPDGSKEVQSGWRQRTQRVENCEKEHTVQASLVLKDADPEWVHSSADGGIKPSELQRKRFLSFFWKILPQKTCNKNAVELIEFARDSGDEDCTLQAP